MKRSEPSVKPAGVSPSLVKIMAGAFFVLTALSALFLLRNGKNPHLAELQNKLTKERQQVMLSESDTRRGSIESGSEELFPDCIERQEYDSLINTDSRTLTKKQLNRAITLHEKCGFIYLERKNFSRSLFGKNLLSMYATASEIPARDASSAAMISAEYWHRIYSLEKELDGIYRRFIDIQGEYWKIELEKITKKISDEVREKKFNLLNEEAYTLLNRVKDIEAHIQGNKGEEGAAWKNLENAF